MGDKTILASILGSPDIRQSMWMAPKLSLPIILISVDQDGESETFGVHKSLLSRSSKFFRAALEEPWEESKGLVELPEADPQLFGVYVQYLYYGKIFSEFEEDGLSADDEWIRLRDLYILGDPLQDECFRNSVMDALVEVYVENDEFPGGLAVDTYANTRPGSPLRRLVVDLHVWAGQGVRFKEEKENAKASRNKPENERIPCSDVTSGLREFLLDVIVAFADAGAKLYKKDKRKPWVKNPCAYHKHKDTPFCKK